MSEHSPAEAFHDNNSARQNGKLVSYVVGLILSIGLTLVAYFAVVDHWQAGWTLAIILLALAIVQFFVQMLFFLHIGREKKPRNRQLVTILMIVIVLIVVIGSVWIMYNLQHRMMPSEQQMKNYMNSQQGL